MANILDTEMRQRSGSINSTDPFVVFVYLLLRDHLTEGDIECVMADVALFDGEAAFSNGWSAQYAMDVVERIRVAGQKKEEEIE